MYGPKLPVTGVSFLMLGVSSFYNITMTSLLILTLSVILFRFIRLLIKEGKLKGLFIIILLPLSIILLITHFGKVQADNKLKQSEEILSIYKNTVYTEQQKDMVESPLTEINFIKDSKTNNFNYYPNSGKVLGSIYIEKISLELPIIEDANDDNLWLGATHIMQTPLPWEKGNSFLASHNIKVYGKLFNRLNEMNISDKVIISIPTGDFTYAVYDKKIVPPDDTKCFEKIKGEYNLSLVTCNKFGGNRVIVFCERI